MARIEKKVTYFQYFKDLKYPIYLEVDLSVFGPELTNALSSLGFDELNDTDHPQVLNNIEKNPHARLLVFKEASKTVALNINSAVHSDRYGLESIVPKNGYKVYRYKGVALMVYSLASTRWEIGCFKHFARSDQRSSLQIVMNRFLSWALSTIGVVGFWGISVEDGMVVMKQQESLGEAVFIDIRQNKMLTNDGAMTMPGLFTVYKLDTLLKNSERRLKLEELHSFLSLRCTYFDYSSLSVPVRQMIQTLSVTMEGKCIPTERFKTKEVTSFS